MKDTKINTFFIKEEQTVISFLKKTLPLTPLSLLYKLFRTKKVKLGDKYLRYYQHRVKPGDVLSIEDDRLIIGAKPLNVKEKTTFRPEVDFEIMYEDENIIIVIKDHNIETHNDKNPEKSLDNAVAYYLKDSGWVSESDLFIVSSSHRLDKLTKGLIVYPKNPSAKKILHDSFGNKDLIRKTYLAACENRKNKEFPSSITGFIFKDNDKEKMIFQEEPHQSKESKKSSMNINELCKKGPFSVLEIELKTGRKHQIRSSLSFLGTPIIGDKKYGSSLHLGEKIKLFAYKIEFINLPKILSYLNGKVFEIDRIKSKLILQVNSSSESLLPKKFLKF
ncbi:MAG: hypothetical protein AM1032_000270 [Mycoplasmataceae bacterium]|nr:MAG: hypothetical protein AM1032_000270 [Mycoplasmataceae bacterium]